MNPADYLFSPAQSRRSSHRATQDLIDVIWDRATADGPHSNFGTLLSLYFSGRSISLPFIKSLVKLSNFYL